nr:MAG TPA: hypothetical protein [Caudoviricetes sp.]
MNTLDKNMVLFIRLELLATCNLNHLFKGLVKHWGMNHLL